jgi:hypothetical protein
VDQQVAIGGGRADRCKLSIACVPVRPGFCRCASNDGGHLDKEKHAAMIARPEGPCPETVTGTWGAHDALT